MRFVRWWSISLTGLFLLIFSFSEVKAQELLRGEIDSKEYDYLYFIPIRENGLISIQHKNHFSGSTEGWLLSHYATSLKQKHQLSFETRSAYTLLDYFDDQDSLVYAFFGATGANGRIEVVRFNYKSGSLRKSQIVNTKHISYDYFNILGQNHFIAGVKNPSAGASFGQFFYTLTLVPIINGSKVYSVPPTLLIHNFKTKESSQKMIDLKGVSGILSTQTNPSAGIYGMVIRNRWKRRTTLHYYEYGADGAEQHKLQLFKLASKNILTGNLISTNDSAFLFMGTYNGDPKKRIHVNSIATGMFISKIKNGKVLWVKFHPFSSFNNAKRALDFRNRKRIEKQDRRGDPTNFGFKLLVHEDVLQQDSSYIIIAESYYPEYHYESYYNVYGSMYSEQIFDGYRFSNSIVAAFGKNGELIWDNNFAIEDILTYNLDENLIVYFDGESQVLLYYTEGYIKSKIISGNEMVFAEEKTEVQTVHEKERVVFENYGKIYHWYGPYFILSGYQVVSDIRGKRRKVFFFLKIQFG
jgi:hypothetical protein